MGKNAVTFLRKSRHKAEWARVHAVLFVACKMNAQTVLKFFTSIKTEDVSKWFKQQAGESLLALQKKRWGKEQKQGLPFRSLSGYFQHPSTS